MIRRGEAVTALAALAVLGVLPGAAEARCIAGLGPRQAYVTEYPDFLPWSGP